MAVIGDLDEFEATVLDDDVDGSGAGVEAVLHQLLRDGAEVDNHLSGLNLVDLPREVSYLVRNRI